MVTPCKAPSLPSVLLCSLEGRYQASLRVLLSGLPLQIIGPVAEARSAIALLDAWHPALVVVDFSLPTAELAVIVQRLQANTPTVPVVALADRTEQVTEANGWGIHTVLLRGFRLEEFYAAVTAQVTVALGSGSEITPALPALAPEDPETWKRGPMNTV